MRDNNLKLDADRIFKKGRNRENQNESRRRSKDRTDRKIEVRNHKKVRPESNIFNSMMSISKIETENMKRGKFSTKNSHFWPILNEFCSIFGSKFYTILYSFGHENFNYTKLF